jgi:hypothetical protein
MVVSCGLSRTMIIEGLVNTDDEERQALSATPGAFSCL